MPAPRELKEDIGIDDSLGITSKDEILKRKQALNGKHAAIMVGGQFVILNEVIDPIFDRPDITLSSVGDFKNKYLNDLIYYEEKSGQVKTRSLALEWLTWKNRRTFEGIVFSPGRDAPGYYNLYRGLDVAPKKGNWERLRSHLQENICNSEVEYWEYLQNWMADFVQRPGGAFRNGVSIVLRGGRGTGKGLFATSFGKIFGSHFLHLKDQNHLTGRFNAHQKDALLIFADECFWAGNKTSEGILKGLITEETIQIEAKGKDPFRVKNHVRLIIASNEDWVVPAGLDERRFFCLDVSDERKQKISYWNPIWEETRNGGIEAMLYDLLRHRSNPEALRTPPKTAALVCQIEHSMKSVQQFWYQCLKEGRFSKDGIPWTEPIVTESLHNSYLDFCKGINEKWPEPRNIFSASIRKISEAHSCRMTPSIVGGPRPHGLVFKSLQLCRARFQEIVNGRLEWEDE